MEEKEVTGNTDNTEIILPSADSPESKEKKPALKQRLAETFREGVASTKPGGEKRSEVKIPPLPKKKIQEKTERKISDKIVAEGSSAAAAVRDKATGAGDALVQIVKKTPDLTRKYADAFREGAASVRSPEGRERRKDAPTAVKKTVAPADGGKGLLDMVLQAGEEAVEFVRKTITDANIGNILGPGQKIRLCRKKINSLYIDIGNEAVNSWSDGIMESEKMTALLSELQKNEEEILNLQASQAQVPQARKAQTASSPQRVKKEAALTPETGKEDSPVEAEVSPAEPAVSLEAAPPAGKSAGDDGLVQEKSDATPEKTQEESTGEPQVAPQTAKRKGGRR